MDCEQLFQKFKQIGGILECDYNKNICKINNTKFSCKIDPLNYSKFEYVLCDYTSRPYLISSISSVIKDYNVHL
jgi:hypothetical protein